MNHVTDKSALFLKILAALEQACREEIQVYSILTSKYVQNDQQAVRYGALVPRVAFIANESKSVTRYQLGKMREAETVLVEPCTGGCSRWWLVGLWESLKVEQSSTECVTAMQAAKPITESAK